MALDTVTYRPQFYGSSFERYARKFIAKYHWRIRHIQPEFDDALQECALEFAGTFYTLFMELWNQSRFPVPGPIVR